MENFFGLLKSELLYLEKFTSYEDFINKLRDYIDLKLQYEIEHSVNP